MRFSAPDWIMGILALLIVAGCGGWVASVEAVKTRVDDQMQILTRIEEHVKSIDEKIDRLEQHIK